MTCEGIAPLEGVVDLALAGDIHADGEIVEGDVLDAFDARVQRHDAQRPCAGDKALRRQRRPNSADRLSDDVGEAHVAEVGFVDGVRAERLVSPRLKSCARPCESALKPGTLAPPCAGRIGIVQRVLIEEVVSAQVAQAASLQVEARRAFVVARVSFSAELEKGSLPTFGCGMYCSSAFAGADHSAAGIVALGKTHCACSVQPAA